MDPELSFHYRGEEPYLNNKNELSLLARKWDDSKGPEKDFTYEKKYIDMYITKSTNDDKNIERTCLLCIHNSKSKTYRDLKDSFSNFKKHINDAHVCELTPLDQIKLKSFKSQSNKLSSSPLAMSFQNASNKIISEKKNYKSTINESFADMIMHGGFPLQMVEDEVIRNGIKNIVKAISKDQINIKFSSSETIRRLILKKLEEENENYKKDYLEEISQMKKIILPICNDSTTSTNMQHFTALTTHIISPKSFEMREIFIECVYHEDVHTQTTALKQLDERLTHHFGNENGVLNLKEFITCANFDCGSNTPRQKLIEKGIDVLECFGHRLNTLQKHIDSFEDLKRALLPIDECLKTVGKSERNLIVLKSVQVQRNVKVLRPIKGSNTRWTYDTRVYERAQLLLPSFQEMPTQKQNNINTMYFSTDQKRKQWIYNLKEWSLRSTYFIVYLLPFYKKIEEYTIKLQYGNQVTISLVLYAIDDLIASAQFLSDKLEADFNSSNMNIMNDIKNQISNILMNIQREISIVFPESKYKMNSIYLVAEYLDIRVARGNKLSKRSSKVLIEFFNHHRISKMIFSNDSLSNSSNDGNQLRNNYFDDGSEDEYEELQRQNSLATIFTAECAEYNRKIISIIRNYPDYSMELMKLDPLIFWKENHMDFPNIWRIAQVILAIPAMSASCERMFSGLKQIITPQRSQLNDEIAGNLILSYMRSKQKLQYQKFQNHQRDSDKYKFSEFGEPSYEVEPRPPQDIESDEETVYSNATINDEDTGR